MTRSHIHIVKMGGTIEFIDSSYDAINQKLLRIDSRIESYLHNLIMPHFDFSTEEITQKDSREITEEDRKKLTFAIERTSHQNIIVTHGTFTMSQAAHFLSQQSVLSTKKVIVTGSMVPLMGFAGSDAGFNLGFAVASFAALESGVYLSMNGGIFASGEVEKNPTLFRFE